MVAYEFYWRDENGKNHLIGILPERRKDSARITEGSIMNWVKTVIGVEVNNTFFNEVIIDNGERDWMGPDPSIR
jgi:hypothetical protein